MKANEAPEKIWINPSIDLPKLNGVIDRESVQYVRTDAFIEKACEWLEKNAGEYAFVDTDRIGNVADVDLSLVQDFKNYMKG